MNLILIILFSGLLCAFSLFGGVAQAETLIPDTEAAEHVGGQDRIGDSTAPFPFVKVRLSCR